MLQVSFSLRVVGMPFRNSLLLPDREPLAVGLRLLDLIDNGATLKYEVWLDEKYLVSQ